jgi:hypothetical protein
VESWASYYRAAFALCSPLVVLAVVVKGIASMSCYFYRSIAIEVGLSSASQHMTHCMPYITVRSSAVCGTRQFEFLVRSSRGSSCLVASWPDGNPLVSADFT